MNTGDKKDHGATSWGAMIKVLSASCAPAVAKCPASKPKKLTSRQLEQDFREICRRNAEGPHATKVDRLRTLLLCARQLFENGVRRKRAVNLNDKDIRHLVDLWHEQCLTTATIRNRLLYLRWLARKIGKSHIIARSNDSYRAGRSSK